MTKDNSTGKNKEFYDLGKKMFDRLNPHIAHNPKVVGPVQEPVAWMVYTQDGQSVYVTDNPTDIQEGQRALPMYTTPPQQQAEPVAQVHPNHLKQSADGNPWCREVLLYSGNYEGGLLNGENYRVKLYTSPPQRQPLTDGKIGSLADSLETWNEDLERWVLDSHTFARAIEAAHGIKENT